MNNERRDQIAEETGIVPEHLTAVDEDKIVKMMERGVLVALHIRYWRPYAKLKESDLGINGTAGDYIDLGRKKLLPPALIAKIETAERRARTALRNNSIRCYWGQFVPTTAWRKWKQESDKLRKRFYEVRDVIVEALPDSMNELRETYAEMARDAYRRSLFDQTAEAPQMFIDNFVSVCLARIPSAEEISRAFSFEEVYSYIPLPAELVKYSKDAWDNEMQRQIATAMYQQKRDMVTGFLTEVQAGMRNMVAKVCQSVRDSIEKNDGKLIPRSTSDLKRMLEKLERLNFNDDAEVTRMVAEIKAEIDKPLKERDVPSINTVLGEVLETCREQVEDIALHTSRFDVIEIDKGDSK